MFWLQLTLESDPENAKKLVEMLQRFDAVSISLSASSNEPIFAVDTEKTNLWERTRITALLDKNIDIDTLLICLRNHVGTENIHSHAISILKDRQWVDQFQASHKPQIIAERLCICPTWCPAPENDIATVYLSPGIAFGTGKHTTTAACLNWMANHNITDKSLIDYGCGSGILALAALKLGAKKVYAIDVDPQALQSTKDNAQRNHISTQLCISHPDAIELPTADILVANILLQPLQTLSNHFAHLLRPGGDIVVSGLLATQADICSKTYARWFTMDAPIFSNEWALLHGIRNN